MIQAADNILNALEDDTQYLRGAWDVLSDDEKNDLIADIARKIKELAAFIALPF